jgi:hypothetical protein
MEFRVWGLFRVQGLSRVQDLGFEEGSGFGFRIPNKYRFSYRTNNELIVHLSRDLNLNHEGNQQYIHKHSQAFR